jgi:hypothetical protein
MAYQSQTYSNNNSGYYIQSAAVINPSSISALVSPVEFLLNSTIQGPYFGSITQDISTFTIAENVTSTLSTINALRMNPTVPVTQMLVSDETNVANQPIIQQWTNTSTIVNGVFKASSKALNNEATAYFIENVPLATFQGQNSQYQVTNTATTSTRFGNGASYNLIYTDIDQQFGQANVRVQNFNGFTRMTPSTFVIGAVGPGAGTETTRLSNDAGAPFNTVLAGGSNVDIRTDFRATNLTPASFKVDGTVSFLSTITAPTVSSIMSNTAASNVSTIANSITSPAAIRINNTGTTDILSTLTAPTLSTITLYSNTINSVVTNANVLNTSTISANSGTINNLIGVSTINAQPIEYYVGNPVGTIISWAGADLYLIPPGYLLCDGRQVLQSQYPALYTIIGNAWGYYAPTPGYFFLPDSRGKTLCGSLGITSPNPPPNNLGSDYEVPANMLGLITVTQPSVQGGLNYISLRISQQENMLYVGMKVKMDGNGFNYTAQITAFVDSDGLWGNAWPNGLNQPNQTIVVFSSDQTCSATVFPIPITFTNNGTDTKLYPFNGNTWGSTAAPRNGFGSYGHRQQGFEVANHVHPTNQPGGQALAGNALRAGDFNVAGPDTSVNRNLWGYTASNGAFLQVPSATLTIPYNIATWQLIKY